MLTQRESVCALDCPDTCALVLDINTEGRAVKLSGDKAHPVTRGFLCAKVTKYLEHEYHPDRLLYPLRRSGVKGEGKFERITWHAALNEIAGRLSGIAREHGPETILPYSYAGTMGMLNGSAWTGAFSTAWAHPGWTGPFAPPPLERRSRNRKARGWEWSRSSLLRRADYRVGRQRIEHERSPMAVDNRSPAQGRKASVAAARFGPLRHFRA
jgi:hypothetical protein